MLRGAVVLPDERPAPGAIILGIDPRGVTIARALANSRGEFLLRFPSAGRYGLQLLRIGYKPVDAGSIAVSDTLTVTKRLVFAPEPITLGAVRIDAPQSCQVRADTGTAIANAWAEARKAMLSTQLDGGAPLVADWVEYERHLDATGRIVRDQQVRISRHPTTHAFRSQPATFLADSGYVVTRDSITTFYVPDVDVLLSDVFASTHCFGLGPAPPEARELIGVSFRPARSRPGIRDVEGTLWLDRSRAELRRLTFAYTNLPDAAAAYAGGEVEFLRLEEGVWIVSRWRVRMPETATERPMFTGLRRIVVSGSRVDVRGIKESGGEVTAVSTRDSLLYQLLGPEILVQVTDGDDLLLPAQAVLTLDGTDYVTTADARGRLALSPVLGGRYHARIRTPLMDSLGMGAVERDVTARSDGHIETVSLPRLGRLVELHAVDGTGAPLAGVDVELRPEFGSGRSVTTHQNGSALVGDLPDGTLTVSARRIGYRPRQVVLSLDRGRTILRIGLEPMSKTLDTIVVRDSVMPLPRHTEFAMRRARREATVSITREDIVRRHPADAWQMLTSVPSLRIVDIDTMVVARSARTTTIANSENDYCYLQVMVDGIVLNKDVAHKAYDLRSLPRPEEIEGIEVFAGAASLPLAYGGIGDGKWCGLIAIWTR